MTAADLSITPWLQPLDGDPCGPDLEYDPAFMELLEAAQGRAETQFAAAEAPSWLVARARAEDLFQHTRDLRVAMLWGRAVVNLNGLEALGPALALLHGLMEIFWDDLHPRPDPDDTACRVRLAVLASLDNLAGLLGDVRLALLSADRRLNGLRVRDCEIARDRLAPPAGSSPLTPRQIEGLFGDLPALAANVGDSVAASLAGVQTLRGVMDRRFGAIDSSGAVELKVLTDMLTTVASLLPAPQRDPNAAPAEGGAGSSPDTAPSARQAGDGAIHSRQDALRAIHRVCVYLEHSEPTNPAQLLLRRAERLIEKDFMQLVRELAPEAVAEVARILGVDPDASDRPGR